MSNREPGQSLSDPRNDGAIMSAWEEFLSAGSYPSDALRRLIISSWERSLSARVDPARQRAMPPIDHDTLDRLRCRHNDLVLASRPVMEMARDFLVETGSIMVLTDPDGIILSLEGDQHARDAAAGIQLIEGCTWSEGHIGTNAIGTALSVGKPVQVHAAEHFCAGIKGWTCTATVIRDPYDGRILGSIDISGLNTTFTPHSLVLVATTASRIESQLAKRELSFRYQLLEQSMGKMAGTHDGIIICDRRGRPIKVNEHATAALRAQGITFELRKTSPIPSLNTSSPEQEKAASLPSWLRPGWIEPIIDKGERIGTLVTIPVQRSSPLAAKARPEPSLRALLEADKQRGFGAIIGNCVQLTDAVEKAKLLASVNVPVLLQGETGTGKEDFARGMHLLAQPSDRPFIALNCGGLSPDLLASELFGYCEGAFTGARKGGMTGKLEAANGGTLFLDEIGELPLDLQPHFLRALEEGEIHRLGENIPRKISFKLIAATHRELRNEVANGRFRMDLYYRLSVTSIRLPPLRDCIGDLPLLVRHFLASFARQYQARPKTIDRQAIALLERYHWPGNVRELRNTVESMFLMARSNVLGRTDLPAEIASLDSAVGLVDTAAHYRTNGNLENCERKTIQLALEAELGNITLAALRLGIAKSTLYTKVKIYGMQHLLSRLRSRP